ATLASPMIPGRRSFPKKKFGQRSGAFSRSSICASSVSIRWRKVECGSSAGRALCGGLIKALPPDGWEDADVQPGRRGRISDLILWIGNMPRLPLPQILERLELTYGKPKRPQLTDPWLLVLWENVAYLATDERRAEAFAALKKRVGTKPEQILAASEEMLAEIASHGILAEQRPEKLRRCARIAIEEFDGDLRQVLKWPLPRARRALQKFPGIGEPGAEKILLFARAHPILGLESNAVRVLLRLGFGEENKNYA